MVYNRSDEYIFACRYEMSCMIMNDIEESMNNGIYLISLLNEYKMIGSLFTINNIQRYVKLRNDQIILFFV